MSFRNRLVISVLITANWVLTPFSYAQEIQWRTDYAAAVKEAAEKNVPILLDIYTTWCIKCVELDATTYRDPGVVKTLNEKFIAVKIDGEKNVVELQGQKVERFPTLFFIGVDGSLAVKQEGYADVALFSHLAEKALNIVAPPRKLVPFQAEARVGSRGQRGSIWKGPRDTWMTPKFSTAPISAKEERMLRARAILAQAMDSYRKQLWLDCLEHTRILIIYYPDLSESMDARQLANAINPESLEKLGQDLNENLSQVYWELAQQKLREGQPSQAGMYMERILQFCPGTRFASPAQEWLNRRNEPATPTKASIKISTR